jgi:hypothetical protein
MKKTKLKKTSYKPKAKSRSKVSPTSKFIIAFVVIGTLIYVAKSYLPKPMPVGINEISPAAVGTVTLSLPASIKSTLNSDTSADIIVDTAGSSVTAVQVELTYDPSTISSPSITQGSFFTQKLTNPKIENGKITFAYAVKIDEKSKTGKGVVATLKFKPTKDNAQISFGKGTMVASVDSMDTNSLKSATGTTITTKADSVVAAPPVLQDIEKSPVTRSVDTNSAPTQKSKVTPETKTNTQTSQSRVFNESGNFDYAKNPSGDSSTDLDYMENSEPTVSGFAKFIASLKKLFGISNDQN